ncbi:MAG: hypothetical protein KDC92_01245 [Bacteroidetes bacterium]|nr:hypothetical protein [Bacteroidota bacterium]
MKNRLLSIAFFCSLFLLGGYQSFGQKLAQQWLDSALSVRATNGSLAIELYNAGIKTAKQERNTDLLALINYELAHHYYSQRAYVEVLRPIRKAINKAKDNDELNFNARLLLGNTFSILGNHDSALVQFKILSEKDNVKDINNRLLTLANLASAQANIGNTASSFKTYFTALNLADSIQNQEAKANLQVEIGSLFKNEGNYAQAQSLYNQALRHFLETNKAANSANVYNHLGEVLMELGSLDSANAYFDRSISIFQEKNLIEELANTYDLIGKLRLAEPNRGAAIESFERAFSVRRRFNLVAEMPKSYLALTQAHFIGKRYNQAMAEARKGLALAKATQSGPYKFEFSQQLYKVFKELNYGDSALVYLEMANEISDSLAQLNNSQLEIRLKTQFEDQQKQQEIERLRATKAANQKVIKNQRFLGLAVMVIAILAIAMVVVMYNRYRLKNRAARLIAAKNKENVLLLKELHHRVKNNLQFIASMISIQRSKIPDEGTRQELKESLQKVTAMALVHNKLYRKSASSEKLSFKYFLAELTDSLALSYGYDTDQIRVKYGWKNPQFDIDTYNALGLIINEMVTNSFKHSGEDVEIEMIFRERSDYHQIIYSDNGPGIDHELTQKEKNTGTVLIELLAQEMGGTLQYVPNQPGEKGIKIVLDLKTSKHNGKS